jgi:hypothetical protein
MGAELDTMEAIKVLLHASVPGADRVPMFFEVAPGLARACLVLAAIPLAAIMLFAITFGRNGRRELRNFDRRTRGTYDRASHRSHLKRPLSDLS